MKKKRLLVVIESLVCAGAEKSLISFLSTLDYSRFEVDLQLFKYGGEFEQFLPEEVRLLPPFEYTQFIEKSVFQQFLTLDIPKLKARWGYSIAIRQGQTFHVDKARLYWKHIARCLPTPKKEYDIAIAYSQGIPTFYVAEKVNAPIKMSWVNAIYHLKGFNKDFQENFYASMNHIVTVSDSAYSVFQEVYPQFASKMVVIWDMLDAQFIKKLSHVKTVTSINRNIPSLLTIGRLNKYSKGYDISLEACKILKERGINFKWYAIGRGPYKEEMEEYIAANNLQDTFILLGTTSNPYPYIKDCTLYVQTSRHEGYGLSIAEARILNRPVVTTEFDAVYNQMVPGKNGLVVKQDSEAVADAIENLLKDKDLYDSIVTYQQQEKKGNQEEIEKFYQLVE